MNAHPGGEEHTRRMLALAGIKGGRVLDMGAGAGESMELLRALGFDCRGIDLVPRSDTVERADMLSLPFADGSFDAVLSQCSFYVSGDVSKALSEAYRVLAPGGVLMLSDVCFEDVGALCADAGFAVEIAEDMTDQWREYYFEALWNGTAEVCRVSGKCRYMLYICRK